MDPGSSDSDAERDRDLAGTLRAALPDVSRSAVRGDDAFRRARGTAPVDDARSVRSASSSTRVPLPTRAPAPTRRPSPPPHSPASSGSSSGAPTRRPDTVTHVASASFVLGPAIAGSTRILDETGAGGRRRGHGLGSAIAAAAERRRAAELQAARHLHERHVALYAWGRCDAGQLGFSAGGSSPTSSEAAEAYPTPRSVYSLDGRDVTHVAGGARHSVAVTSAGEVYAFGDCSGEGKVLSAPTRLREAVIDPPEVTATTNAMPRVATVACGQRHCAAVTMNGVLLSWGNEEFGQLGQGPPRDSSSKGDAKSLIRRRADASMMPRLVGSGHVKFTSVACGAGHTLALTANGRVFSFGRGAFGALGHGDRLNCDVPRLVDALWGVGVTQIAAGDNHSASLSASGRVYTWGRGKYGALGHRDVDNRSRPTPVQALDDAGVRCEQIACGGDHTLAIAGGGSGVILAWGRGSSGPAGTGATADVLTPTIIDRALLGNEKVFQISAGSKHSVAVTEGGCVYTWGARTQGQLGHELGDAGTSEHGVWKLSTGGGAAVSAVAKVAGLPAGRDVLYAVAAGDHTFAAVAPGKGAATTRGRMPWSGAHGWSLRAIELPPILELAESITALDPEVDADECHRIVPELIRAVEDVFSSPGFIVEGFAAPRFAEESESDACTSGLDVTSVEAVYSALCSCGRPEIIAALANASAKLLEALLDALQRAKTDLEDVNDTRVVVAAMIVLWMSPLNGDPALGDTLVPRLVAVTEQLTATGVGDLLIPWLAADIDADVFERRLVSPLMGFLTRSLGKDLARKHHKGRGLVGSIGPSGRTSPGGGMDIFAIRAAQMLGMLHAANEIRQKQTGEPIVPASVFYSQSLSDSLNLREEYMRLIQLDADGLGTGTWGGDRMNSYPACLRPGELVTFCQLPFLLTAEAKGRILQGEANLQKRHEMRMSHLSAIQNGQFSNDLPFGSPDAPFLELVIERGNLLKNALDAVASKTPADLKKPLRIKFNSDGVEEEGVDEGGVTKEFFQLMVREMFKDARTFVEFSEHMSEDKNSSLAPPMFTLDEESRYHWFNPAASVSTESLARFRLFGAALGLAIYNGVCLDVHLPPVAYRRLCGMEPTLVDLCELSPSLGEGLQTLLDYDGDDIEEVFYRDFVVERFDAETGRTLTTELKPGGEHTAVTGGNRKEFVKLYVQHALDKSVSAQFGAFKAGFEQVCGGPALGLFTPTELELLVCGDPEIDMKALERVTKYDGGFDADHRAIRDFWSVVHSLPIADQKRLLFFATGCDRAPVGGLENLPFVVQRSGPDTEHLPTAHTCFNVLLLPEYDCQEKLRDRLAVAIANAEGFGLQ